MKAYFSKRGFTLIELLVVIAIISILSAVLYANFGDARESARNQAMRAELKEVQLALEVYKSQFDRYPDAHDEGDSGCKDTGSEFDSATSIDCLTNPYIDGLTPDYIVELPSHLKSGNTSCELVYQVDNNTNGDRYKLTARNCIAGVTSATGIQQDDELARCPSVCNATPGTCGGSTINASYLASDPFIESLAVYSAGAECW